MGRGKGKNLFILLVLALTACQTISPVNAAKWQPIKDLPSPAITDYEPTTLTINRVHDAVAHDFKYIPDTVDTWKTPDQFKHDHGGDCEDFAIYMGFELMKRGFRREDMQLLVGKGYDGPAHATLQVRDENGNKIIDDARYVLPVPKNDYIRDWGWKTLETYQF